MIDHAYHPHIIDLIFEHAPPASLFAMSHACSAWRHRSHRKFTYIRSFSVRRTRKSRIAVRYKLGRDGPRFRAILDRPAGLSMLKHCRVLDLVSVVHLERTRQLVPPAHTVRFRSADRDSLSILPDTVKRLVFSNTFPSFARDLKVESIVYTDSGTSPGPMRLDAPFPHVLKAITYVLTSGENAHPAAYVGKLRGIITMSCEARIPLRRVNIPLSFVDSVALNPALDPQGLVRFMTLDEYRESIGEREFAIETDWRTDLKL